MVYEQSAYNLGECRATVRLYRTPFAKSPCSSRRRSEVSMFASVASQEPGQSQRDGGADGRVPIETELAAGFKAATQTPSRGGNLGRKGNRPECATPKSLRRKGYAGTPRQPRSTPADTRQLGGAQGNPAGKKPRGCAGSGSGGGPQISRGT